MMTFRERVQDDFHKVLLNTGEYGRICDWNGKPLQIADDAFFGMENPAANGVNNESKRIACRDIDLVPAPAPMEEVMLDGEPWYVTDVRKPFAHLLITLARRLS